MRIGTAGWSIPKADAGHFPAAGSNLARYAARLNAVEINSSFYRPHRRSTYERWAATVSGDFRFSVKIPKAITHERRLIECNDLLLQFRDEVAGLGAKLGPLLLQLPPSLPFSDSCGEFLELLRGLFEGALVCEPRHRSWLGDVADAALRECRIGRVAADPARLPETAQVGGWGGIAYYRLHGSPRIYWSDYGEPALRSWGDVAQDHPHAADRWIIFDNTASGAAMGNAMRMTELVA